MNDNWSEKIEELEGKGWSLKKIGDEISLSVSSISDIKNGRTKSPTGMAAVKLYQLHERICLTSAQAANDDQYTEASDAAG